MNSFDCIVLAVAHDAFKHTTLDQLKSAMNGNPVLVDVRGLFARQEAEKKGICYETL